MKTADAWATETPAHATTVHKALEAKIAADREAYLANGGQIRRFGPTGRQIEYDWRSFTAATCPGTYTGAFFIHHMAFSTVVCATFATDGRIL